MLTFLEGRFFIRNLTPLSFGEGAGVRFFSKKIAPISTVRKLALFCLFPFFIQTLHGQQAGWKAQWIAPAFDPQTTNSWLVYHHEVDIASAPEKEVIAKIATDTKYWLWINGQMAVFEGGLKRGPNPNDTYYDEVNIAKYLKKGNNAITVLVWYFGRNGFSHKSSGKGALIFDCRSNGIEILSDATWKGGRHPSFGTTFAPHPNFRLAESNIRFDARKGKFTDLPKGNNYEQLGEMQSYGTPPAAPWNNLVKRPVPQWKDSGLKPYPNRPATPFVASGDTIVCSLPYNAQVTPYFKIEAAEGQQISLFTDNYSIYNGSAEGIRAEYITCSGVQEYENLGWLNGHKVYYVIPKGVKVLDLGFRETGYNSELTGSFTCSDPFFNRLWKKAQRTLYLNMRDTYMDCPDRERAQWTGDAVSQSAQAFYALSPASTALTKKWLQELFGWQKADGSLFSPIPAGNWDKELPGQVAASVGYYGLWNYYWSTGDLQLLKDNYAKVQKYISLWEVEKSGLVKQRMGGWTWGDWGDNKDMLPLFNLWYYLAVKGMYLSALELGYEEDAAKYRQFMQTFKEAFNKKFWNGKAYRNPLYKDKTDDRVQALAVVAGVADRDKYTAIRKVFKEEFSASPYMEKYVFEAMFQMGYAAEALARHKKRFEEMVNDERFSTLFEGWKIGSATYGGGTVNHSWSGGGLTILAQYVAGVFPLEPGFKKIGIKPQLGSLTSVETKMTTEKGDIAVAVEKNENKFSLKLTIPTHTTAQVYIPKEYSRISVNNKKLKPWGIKEVNDDWMVELPAGSFTVQAVK